MYGYTHALTLPAAGSANLVAKQSSEQGMAVLVWQSRIIVLYKPVPNARTDIPHEYEGQGK